MQQTEKKEKNVAELIFTYVARELAKGITSVDTVFYD